MKHSNAKQNGFTIIELLIATAVFSTILLLCTFGLLQIGRVYLKGLTLTRTQETSRNAIGEVSQAIQYSGSSVDPINVTSGGPGTTVVFCVGNTRYTFITDRQLTEGAPVPGDQTNQGFIKDEPNSCNPVGPQPPFVNPKELLGINMRLMNFSITKIGTTDSYKISLRVVFGDSILLTRPDHQNCQAGNSAGGGFCAVSELTTTVQQRVK